MCENVVKWVSFMAIGVNTVICNSCCSISFSYIQQLCRNGSVSTPLLSLNNNFAGTSYKEPFPNSVRTLSTSSVCRDIDSASKFIGAGMATVGMAGSGMCFFFLCKKKVKKKNNSWVFIELPFFFSFSRAQVSALALSLAIWWWAMPEIHRWKINYFRMLCWDLR